MKQCMGCMEKYSDEFNVCPHCGYVEGTQAEEAIHINPGQMIVGRYIVGKVLGYGGFGVTYIGWDTKLQQKVAIKEYLPSEFSTRLPGQTRVTVMSGEKSEQFFDGLEKFVEEAKRLAKFQNEDGIVKVFDSFTENETAYIVMEYLDGETLTAYMEREGTIPENDAVKMLEPVMNSLQVVHEAGILHRDIAPDNIFITKSGEVKLIDFGASRYATTSHSRSLTVIIKQGYSPEEQYRSRGDQGPHTDVYSLSATLYKMITGKTPPDAMKRRASFESKNKDILEEPHRINKDISINRENAILNALNVRIEDRTPDVATFYRELHSDKPAKRLYGKIKKLDLYSWPLWAKIVVPTVAVAIITFAVLLLTGVIKFESLFSDVVEIPEGMTTVPGVEGMTIEEAEDELEEAGLLYSLDRNVESEYVDPGKVLLQNPNEGSYLEINGTVSLAVSRGSGVESPVGNEATVPFLTACTLEEAKQLLSEAGLGEPIIEYAESDSVPAGQVISQSIDFGEKLETGTQITLVVSSGPPKFAMPYVVGVELETAKNALLDFGLVVTAQDEGGEEADKGVVISQNIPAGTEITKGSSILLTVSNDEDMTTVSRDISIVTIAPSNPQATTSTTAAQGNAQGTTARTTTANNAVTTRGTTAATKANTTTKAAATTTTKANTTTKAAATTTSKAATTTEAPTETVRVIFNANGGTCQVSGREFVVGSAYGSLPTAEKDYFTFIGWYTAASGGTKVTEDTVVSSNTQYTLYAQWTMNTVSGWVLESDVPDDALLWYEKWTYTLTETTTSTSSSMSGWTQTGYEWEQTGTGTHYYATFPSGYSTSNSLYQKYSGTKLSSSESTSTKRTVTDNGISTYVYYHWSYSLSGTHSEGNRYIGDYYNQYISGCGYCNILEAFESTTNYAYDSSAGAYKVTGHSTYSWWWFRLNVYKQTYTDYQKVYTYQKVTPKESDTEVTEGSGISNVQKYVQYVPK